MFQVLRSLDPSKLTPLRCPAAQHRQSFTLTLAMLIALHAVALLRLVPISPFTVFNFAAGASHLGYRQFMLGSMLGLAPGIGAITLFSGSLWGAITSPSPQNIIATVVIATVLLLFVLLARRWLRSA